MTTKKPVRIRKVVTGRSGANVARIMSGKPKTMAGKF